MCASEGGALCADAVVAIAANAAAIAQIDRFRLITFDPLIAGNAVFVRVLVSQSTCRVRS